LYANMNRCPRMRVLGLDLGLFRTGLAMSDETGTAIRLLPNLLAKNRAQAIEKIISLVNEFAISVILIGYPEQKTPQSIAIASRAEGLKKTLDDFFHAQSLSIEVHLWDEALSSKRALAKLTDAGLPQKKRRSLLDSASAAVLIEDFLCERLREPWETK
jgi:putative Holliday junction resolvase